ncbi:uncharacterized protein BCR38DRAFT_452702 [Pseudomassariella vexata]|uniref:Uncharacterized protein n=1 Tax=Pseudomassariella vexata TaxID=1141098 RepID=A0A1Y2D7Q4_9PEZI|nr:uncharacterized protein BCR38DRAFT_452702 [Pseudomassariella vexata]ORY55302.1 hypothetical protein BCR38DRAFT_452702 [Pseudomassariella vexata]
MQSTNALGTQAQNGASTPAKAKLVKRQPRPKSCVTPSASPGISAAVDKQFGCLGSSSESKRHHAMAGPLKCENVSPYNEMPKKDDTSPGSSGHGPDDNLDAQSIGSRKMVDIFLNSRRRRINGSEDTDAFV